MILWVRGSVYVCVCVCYIIHVRARRNSSDYVAVAAAVAATVVVETRTHVILLAYSRFGGIDSRWLCFGFSRLALWPAAGGGTGVG